MALRDGPECGRPVSTAAWACSHCGYPVRSGYDFRTRASWLGWPLVAVATGVDPATGRKRVAKGWVAVGGMATGGLAAGAYVVGGSAIGYRALGGQAIGRYLTAPPRWRPRARPAFDDDVGELPANRGQSFLANRP